MSLDIFLILSASIVSATSLLFPSLGECFTELSGVYNIGTEGIMLISSSMSFIGAIYTGNPWIGLLLGILSGGIVGAFLALFSVNAKANQIIFGLGIILLGTFLSVVIVDVVHRSIQTLQVPRIPTVNAASLGYPLNIILSQSYLVYFALVIAAAMWLLFFKTRFGLVARATGENANVAASTGANVFLMRYTCAILGSAIAAMGGAFILLGITGIWSQNITAGRGFIAIAVVRIGFFRPLLILVFSLVFGLVDSLQLNLQTTNLGLPTQVLQMMPYIVGLLALIASARFRTFREPASIGKPYDREQR